MGRGVRSSPTRGPRHEVMMLATGALLVIGACGGGDDVAGDTTEGVTTLAAVDDEAATTQPPVTAPPAETVETTPTADTIDPPLALAGTSWVITNYDYLPSSTGITNPLGEEAVLVFGDDGTLTGHTGCNEFTGTWEITGPYYVYDAGDAYFEDKVDGQPLTITADVATTAECEGWVGEQDVDVIGALVAAEIWYVGNLFGDEAGGITLHSETGRVYADPA